MSNLKDEDIARIRYLIEAEEVALELAAEQKRLRNRELALAYGLPPKPGRARKGRAEEMAQQAVKEKTKKEIEEELRSLSIAREGTKISIPPNISIPTAIDALRLRMDEEEKILELHHDFQHTVPEGALALYDTLQDLYGFIDKMGVPGFWADKPPKLISIQTSFGKNRKIPWGRFGVPGVEGWIETDVYWVNQSPRFRLSASIRGKNQDEFDRIVNAIQARTDSIYRGHAISVEFPNPKESSFEDFFPKFMEVQDLTKSDVVFSADIYAVINTALFTPIERTEACRAHNIPLKRGILLEGPFGVGKTLTASITARLCELHNWTFIYLKDVRDLPKVYEFARHHQPAVIFSEDLDQVLSDSEKRDEEVNNILNSVDGVDSKGVEVITVLTTNHVDKITTAMLRPGRTDTIVPVRPPDSAAAQRLVRLFAGPKMPESEDLSKVGTLLAGKMPAVIREVVERSKLAAVSRLTDLSDELTLTAQDVQIVAVGMDSHMKLLEPKPKDNRSATEKGCDILGHHIQQAALSLIDGAKPNGHALVDVGLLSDQPSMSSLPPGE